MKKDFNNQIKHVAIIMDGNGRWAQARAHSRIWGHIRGSRIVSQIVEEADDLKIESLTLYAFSTENWSRPLLEVKTLFSLLKKFIKKEKKRILANGIRFKVMGDISALPDETKGLVYDLEALTKSSKGLKLNFAFGYGGRDEIIKSVNCFIKKNPGKELTKEDLEENLLIPDIGDVDLLIRTGGDMRVSNFLLWQIAYAELYFTKTKWPAFKKTEFRDIIHEVNKRERRFGATKQTDSLDETSLKADENLRYINDLRRK